LPPVQLGGVKSPVADAFELFEAISAVNASSGRCGVICAGSSVFAGYLPESGAREVFADPDRSTATMFAGLGTRDDCGHGWCLDCR
jgi:indole-3-acetate monooxygenase